MLIIAKSSTIVRRLLTVVFLAVGSIVYYRDIRAGIRIDQCIVRPFSDPSIEPGTLYNARAWPGKQPVPLFFLQECLPALPEDGLDVAPADLIPECALLPAYVPGVAVGSIHA